MNVIRNKLRAKDGASIFMGLMFLLVCLMVGAVVLAAATAAAGKLAELRETEQNYLNVASAAQMVRDKICEMTYTYETVDGNVTENKITVPSGEVILEDELKKLCEILVENQGEADLQKQLDDAAKTFEISGTVDKWDTVHGLLSMKEDGRIIVGLWLVDKDESGGGAASDEKIHNHMEIEFCADGPVTKTVVEEIDGTDADGNPIIIETVTKTTTCSWPETGCTIMKGIQYEDEGE